jgi:hypothetical protein
MINCEFLCENLCVSRLIVKYARKHLCVEYVPLKAFTSDSLYGHFFQIIKIQAPKTSSSDSSSTFKFEEVL